jgi:hypothetical protein
VSVRTFRNTPAGAIAIGWTELDAASQSPSTISLARLFGGDPWSWRKVDDEMEKRAANREALAATRRLGDSSANRRERENVRALVFATVNRKVAARIAAADDAAAAAARLIAALPPPPECKQTTTPQLAAEGNPT